MDPEIPCEGCGLCCMHMNTPPYDDEERELLHDDNPRVYADLLAVEETRALQLTVTGSEFVPCGFFDLKTRKCIHHDYKPVACRRFEVGDIYCNGFRSGAGLPIIDLVAGGAR